MVTHLRVGIDIGGTFTDLVVWDAETGELTSLKLLSTPAHPGEAVVEGLERVLGGHERGEITIIHGSTVATNALLERKGARTALITTSGFGDVLQIGRQNRPALYDLFAEPPAPLVPAELRLEVGERIDKDGKVLRPLEEAEVAMLGEKLRSLRAESVAICLLFSFANPSHEQLITSGLRAAGFAVSASCEILPEFREYERASTTAVNAYVSPLIDSYLGGLQARLGGGTSAAAGTRPEPATRLQVMQSNGGIISPDEAARSGVRCVLSGPAGGVLGCQHVAHDAFGIGRPGTGKGRDGVLRVVTFDMGGTSTDVSLISGRPGITTEAVIGGCPIRVPMLDVHTIGAGGGSVATVDAGGALRVGPESAGADPGPACYGRHTDLPPLPTVTDANLVLGRLAPDHFLGGEMKLSSERAWQAFTRLGAELGLDAVEAARGVVQVVNAHMERALRVISVERGHDPRDFTLLSFGGAGGLHCAELARSLGIRQVLVPPLASTLSAFGMITADVVKDYTQTVMLEGDVDLSEVEQRLAPLISRGRREVEDQGISDDRIRVETSLDMRYRGQSYELAVPFTRDFRTMFHDTHRQTYGFSLPGAAVEIVNLRVKAIGEIEPPRRKAAQLGDADPSAAFLETRPVTHNEGATATPFYVAEMLRPGNCIVGAAIVVRADTTVLVGPRDTARVDGFGNLFLDISPN
jgi:N-methylhydantoinase A